MKIRIKFTKQGTMKFIGHLDMMRYFQKVMRRAQVDIRYSEGFSPHQIMSFAAPLGVGLTSRGEYMDIEVLSTEDSKTMVERMNQVMAEGTRVLSYRLLDDSCKNAMSVVAAADYLLTFRDGDKPEDLDGFFREFLEFCRQPQIMITKETKKGQREVDLKPLIYKAERQGEAVFLQVSTGSTDNIKPELVMEAFYRFRGEEYPPFAMMIEREEVYADLGEEGSRRLVALEDLGQDIE